jgi:hypothetical protein
MTVGLEESSGLRVHATGAVRDQRVGKGRMDLLFLGFANALRVISHHCEKGAEHYGDRNWEHGQSMSWFLDSGGRHLLQWAAGETNEDHLRAAAWNILAALETRERIERGELPEALNDLALPLNARGAPGAGDAMPLPQWTEPFAAHT